MFHGLSAFPPTPTDASGKVQADALCGLVDRIRQAGADSIGLLGSTGGYAYLTREERRRAIEAAVGCVGGKIPLIVGIGALRTDEAQALARDAKAAGADGLLLAPMSYTPLTGEEVYQHMLAVAGSTDLPLSIYNNPTTTKFTFTEPLIARLSQVANIVAVKMPLPADADFSGEISRLREQTPATFSIGYSGDWGAAEALLAGGNGWYSVVAGLLPASALALTRAAQSGNATEALRIDAQFQPLWALFKEFGSFRVMYVIGSLLGRYEAEPPRPILPLPRDARARVAQAIEGLS